MNITVETQPSCRAAIRIEIPASDVQNTRSSITKGYTQQAKLPGFRPGKAPQAIVAKKFDSEITEELQNTLVRQGYQAALKRDDVQILNLLDVKDLNISDEGCSYVLEVSTVPQFELPEYKALPVKLAKVDVSDADIDHDLLHLTERFATFDDVEREAALNDFVVLNATGSIDGKPTEETAADAPAFLKKIEGNWFQLTENETFLPGFFAALVGIKKDETREIKVTLADDFFAEALRGKEVTFSATAQQVKERQLPEVNDEFAQKLNKDWNVEQLRDEVKKVIEQRRTQAREDSKTSQIIEHLAEKLEFELPEELVQRETQRRTNDIARNAMSQGMDQQALLEAQGQIIDAASQQARQNVKVSFILGEIAKKENISVSDDQIRGALAQIAARQNLTPKKLMAEARKSDLINRLREDLLLENALQFLKSNAAVEEVEAEPEDCGHEH